MLEEPEAQALPHVRALDDTGNIRGDERPVVRERHHTEVRLERREGVIGDLRASGGNDGEQRALARVRLAQEPDVGDQFEHQLELSFLAVLARLPFARAAMRRSGEARVAAAAAPTLRHEQGVAAREHLADELTGRGVAHLGAGWDREVEVGPRLAGHVLALAVLPPLGLPLGAIAIIQERREVHVGAHEDTTARSALPAVGPAFGDELFAAEGAGSGATGATDHVHYCPIYEHQGERGTRNAERGTDPRAPRAV